MTRRFFISSQGSFETQGEHLDEHSKNLFMRCLVCFVPQPARSQHAWFKLLDMGQVQRKASFCFKRALLVGTLASRPLIVRARRTVTLKRKGFIRGLEAIDAL